MKKLSKITESIWSDMQDRSIGKTVREEDMIITNKDLKRKIRDLYEKQGKGDTLDVSSLTNMIKCDDFSYLFSGYMRVKHIIGLKDWDVSNVQKMNSMFCGCNNFNSDLSKWDVSSVGDMKCMFMGCEKFNCDLSKWDVSNVGDMDAMVWGCSNFNSDLSNWDVSSVGNMELMFSGCINFDSDLSKWDVSNVENMKYMFSNCKSLKQLPSWYFNNI